MECSKASPLKSDACKSKIEELRKRKSPSEESLDLFKKIHILSFHLDYQNSIYDFAFEIKKNQCNPNTEDQKKVDDTEEQKSKKDLEFESLMKEKFPSFKSAYETLAILKEFRTDCIENEQSSITNDKDGTGQSTSTSIETIEKSISKASTLYNSIADLPVLQELDFKPSYLKELKSKLKFWKDNMQLIKDFEQLFSQQKEVRNRLFELTEMHCNFYTLECIKLLAAIAKSIEDSQSSKIDFFNLDFVKKTPLVKIDVKDELGLKAELQDLGQYLTDADKQLKGNSSFSDSDFRNLLARLDHLRPITAALNVLYKENSGKIELPECFRVKIDELYMYSPLDYGTS